jgi:hypothetical protein
MAKKLTKLTGEQEARIPEYRDRYMTMGLSTQAADRERAKAGVIKAYRAAGVEPPKLFIWLNSPMAGAYGAALLSSKNFVGAQVWDQVGDQVGDQVRDQVWAQVGDQVRDQVRDQVGDQVRDQVWAQVGDQVRDQVRDQVGDQVGDQVWAQVRDQVRDQVGDQVWDQVYRAGYGQHDAGWLAFYDFFKMSGIADAARLDGLYELCASAGWWWPFQGAVIITERPNLLNRDERGRLHSENAPAIRYPDGWAIHAVHGVRMPGELVEDHSKITVARIDTESNAEVRRVLIGWYGVDRYMRDSGARVVHADNDPLGNPRRLLWRDLPGDEPIVMVEVTDSTPQPDGHRKIYTLRVDPKAYGGKAGRECHAAIASTWRHKGDANKLFFAKPEAYQPVVET